LKKIELGQMITILANIGVIAGIVFLGFELQQNNELQRSQIRSNFQGARLGINFLITDSQWLPGIFAKVETGDPLSAEEAIRLQAQHQNLLTLAQWMYEDYTALGLEPPAERIRATFRGQTLTPGISQTWEAYKKTVPPEFVEWMEENVVNER